VIDELERVGREASEALSALKPGLAELDRGLAQNAARSARQVRDMIEKLRAKAERVHANRSGRGQQHTRRVKNALAPRGELQERVLGPLSLLARYGTSWIEALFEHVAPLESGHLVATIHRDETDNEEGAGA